MTLAERLSVIADLLRAAGHPDVTAAGGVMTISPDPDSDDWPDYDTDEDED